MMTTQQRIPMSNEIVELLVEVPGLPVQVGRFRRVGKFGFDLVEPLVWKPGARCVLSHVLVRPTDRSWVVTNVLYAPLRQVDNGDTLTIAAGDLIVRGVDVS